MLSRMINSTVLRKTYSVKYNVKWIADEYYFILMGFYNFKSALDDVMV